MYMLIHLFIRSRLGPARGAVLAGRGTYNRLYHNMQQYAIISYHILLYTILYYAILHKEILYYTILYLAAAALCEAGRAGDEGRHRQGCQQRKGRAPEIRISTYRNIDALTYTYIGTYIYIYIYIEERESERERERERDFIHVCRHMYRAWAWLAREPSRPGLRADASGAASRADLRLGRSCSDTLPLRAGGARRCLYYYYYHHYY